MPWRDQPRDGNGRFAPKAVGQRYSDHKQAREKAFDQKQRAKGRVPVTTPGSSGAKRAAIVTGSTLVAGPIGTSIAWSETKPQKIYLKPEEAKKFEQKRRK